MRPLRIWLALAVPAALAALVLAAVPAASKARAAAAPQVKGVVEIHPGLVKDCEYISNTGAGGSEIVGHGPGNPVSLTYTGASCFDLCTSSPGRGTPGGSTRTYPGTVSTKIAGSSQWAEPAQPRTPARTSSEPNYKDVGWLVSEVFDITGSYMYSPSCLQPLTWG